MTGFFDGPRVDVTASSGMLCATVHSKSHWLAALVVLGCGNCGKLLKARRGEVAERLNAAVC